MAKQNAKKITQQWVQASIFEALSECAMCRPDFEVSVSALGNQGNIYLARMVFHNCGNTTFTSRLLNFALIAMRDHYKGPHFAVTPVTSQPESVPEPAPDQTNQEASN